ncbi:MAG TPA: acyl-CoA dehydrogenase, partial [Flavobacteriales bacterium]|nr:acyl-CoA dehydrogenase [Flavobacteriales bacterium]
MIARTLFNEELDLFRKSVRDFFAKEIIPHHDKWEEQGHISREAWLKTGEQGFLLTEVPEEFGGAGVDFRYSAILMEELAHSGCSGPGFALHSDIVAPYILHQANDEQKKRWFPKMASGELISAIAMTEPGTGSDLQAVTTTAKKDGDDYIINGSKTFITNGYMCDLVIIVAKTGDNEISLIMVEADREGFTKDKPLKKIGMKAQDTCQLYFDNVRVPQSNLLGVEGAGFMYLMQELPQERLLVAIIAIATAEEAFNRTVQYVQEREAFGRPIAKFQNTRFKLAEMLSEIQMGRIFIDKCIELHLKQELDVPTAAMAKYTMTELQCKVVDECVQLHGGYGYMWEFWIARAYADSRAQ